MRVRVKEKRRRSRRSSSGFSLCGFEGNLKPAISSKGQCSRSSTLSEASARNVSADVTVQRTGGVLYKQQVNLIFFSPKKEEKKKLFTLCT